MSPRRDGRGRPALFTPEAQQRYLKARLQGATQADAAAAAGVAPRTVRDTRRTNPAFRTADDQARKAGRLARVPHGESRYNNLGCRCPICTRAASTGRNARARTRAPRKPRKKAPVVPLNPPASPPGQGSPGSFPLADAS